MTASLFLTLVSTTAAAVIAGLWRWAPRRTAAAMGVGLLAWLAYVGAIGMSGVLADATRRPPAIVVIVGPAALFIAVALVRGSLGRRLALAVPLPALIGVQVYRIGVELVLHRLWIEGLAPRMLTFAGANFDIGIGVTALVVAWAASRGSAGRRIAAAWNVLGLFSLLNVVARSALTAPGPLHLLASEAPNRAIATVPYMFIPGFLAPLAVALHVLALRALLARRMDGRAHDPQASVRQATLVGSR